MEVEGRLSESSHPGQTVEMKANNIKLIGQCNPQVSTANIASVMFVSQLCVSQKAHCHAFIRICNCINPFNTHPSTWIAQVIAKIDKLFFFVNRASKARWFY